jgi:hypothetical protein
MKINILFCILFLFSISFIQSQNKVNINFGYGIYLSNSENSLKIVGDESFRSYLHYGFTYQRENLLGHNLMFEYSYHQITLEDALIFVRTGEHDPTPIGYFGADVSLVSHNFDLNYISDFGQYFSYGIGPSFIIANRIIDIEETLYDKLASSGIGINGLIEFTLPFSESENYFFFTSMFKLRYTYSIWIDEGIRKLDDYHQEFLTTQISIGLGYSF